MGRAAVFAVVVLVGVVVPSASRACFVASHHWRIVLGESRDGVVILDLPLERNEREVPCKLSKKDRSCYENPFQEPSGAGEAEGIRHEVYWAGEASLKLFTANGQEPTLLTRLGTLSSVRLEADVRALLARAQKTAAHVPGLAPLGLPNQDFCDYSRSWGRYELISDEQGSLRLALSRPNHPKQLLGVSLPDAFRSALIGHGSPKEAVRSLRIMSVLSYAVPDGELLVLDLGTGDEMRDPVASAVYPPCGCEGINDCPPLPSTVHHGQQAQVIVRSPLPAPVRPQRAQPPTHELTASSLAAAEKRARFRPRSDGVYLSPPACPGKTSWSRFALRFTPTGHASAASGNLSPMDAAILTSKHYVGLETAKPCSIRGARFQCELGPGLADSEPGDEDAPVTLLDGRWDGKWLDVLVTPPAGAKPRVEGLRFVPLNRARLDEIDQ